jgi:predicted esterase
MGIGQGYGKEWKRCLACYKLSEETVLNFKGHPIDKIDLVLKAAIPIIIVAGDADTIVPYNENSAVLVNYYREKGGIINIIVKSGVGHHPHGLEDPKPIIEFLVENCIS